MLSNGVMPFSKLCNILLPLGKPQNANFFVVLNSFLYKSSKFEVQAGCSSFSPDFEAKLFLIALQLLGCRQSRD